MMARSRGGDYWLANAHCAVDSVDLAGQAQPVSLQLQADTPQSYVLSPRSAWVNYARHEALRHVSPKLAWLAKAAGYCVLSPVSALLHGCGLDKAAIVGNHLISTNLHSEWSRSDISNATDQLTAQYPDSPLIIRNISSQVTPNIEAQLTQLGWHLIPARMIYLCDPNDASVWKRNHVKQDAKLLANKDIEVITPDQIQASDLPQLRQLFRQLFIEKHSRLNPDFTPAFFELCHENGFLDLYALRMENRLVGVLGIYQDASNNWITTPLIGYDNQLPQSAGIYRRLMALLLQQAKYRQTKLHYSSGASQFKLARGGVASLEYTAIYSRHLSSSQITCNRLFSYAMQNLAPRILKRADAL